MFSLYILLLLSVQKLFRSSARNTCLSCADSTSSLGSVDSQRAPAPSRPSLGVQALALHSVQDRLVALRRTTAAMQVMLARHMVLRALSLIAVRYRPHFTRINCTTRHLPPSSELDCILNCVNSVIR